MFLQHTGLYFPTLYSFVPQETTKHSKPLTIFLLSVQKKSINLAENVNLLTYLRCQLVKLPTFLWE